MMLADKNIKRGMMFVLSSPSGAGKTTIAKALLASDENLYLSVSKTTRNPRLKEICGRDYFFTDKETFLKDVDDGAFLEYADVFGNLYGTPKRFVENILSQGKDVLFDVDWQGAAQLRQKAPSDFVSVFILPPSLEVLANRLYKRASDDEQVIRRRLKQAKMDIDHFINYDYVLINENIDCCISDVFAILKAERLKRERNLGLVDFIQTMKNEAGK